MQKLRELIKRYFISGIAITFPLFISIFVVVFIIRITDELIGNKINACLLKYYGFDIPGLGIILLILILLLVGFLSNLFLGRKLFQIFDRAFKKIPLLATIYPPAKELSDFLFTSEGRGRFKKVVLVEYPVEGSYSIGFITNEELNKLSADLNNKLISVLVPHAPTPFSGMLLFLEERKIKVLDITVDQAVKLIVSGGVVLPQK